MRKTINIKILLSFIFFGLAILFTSLALNSYQIYIKSRAATSPEQACQTTLALIGDKCSGGVFSNDVCQFKPGGDIAVGWTKYVISGNPKFENTDYSSLGEGTIKMTPNGSNNYKAGAYTQVDVTPGKIYCASWRWGAPGPDDAPNHHGRTLGIDPSGGTDPNSSTVIWGNTHTGPARHLDYVPPDVNVDIKTTATSNRMTVFFRIDYDNYPGSVMYIDGINLYDEGVSNNPIPTNPPQNTPVPTIPTNTPVPPTQQPGNTNTPAPTTINPTNPADTPTNSPMPNSTNTPIPSNTPLPTATDTPIPTPTDSPIPTNTSTPTPSFTPIPSNTPTPTNTATPVPTYTPYPTYTIMPTYTPQPTQIAQIQPSAPTNLTVNNEPPGITPWAFIAIPLGLILIGLLL